MIEETLMETRADRLDLPYDVHELRRIIETRLPSAPLFEQAHRLSSTCPVFSERKFTDFLVVLGTGEIFVGGPPVSDCCFA